MVVQIIAKKWENEKVKDMTGIFFEKDEKVDFINLGVNRDHSTGFPE